MLNATEKMERGRASRLVTGAAFALLALCLPGPASAQWTTNGTNINTTNTGAVGIGTSAPDVALGDTGQGKTVNVQSDVGYSMIRLTRSTAGGSEMGRVTFGSPAFTGTEKRTAVILSGNETSSTILPSGNVRFFTSSAGTMAERMRLTSGGHVGIGTSTPDVILGDNGTPEYGLVGTILNVQSNSAYSMLRLTNSGTGTVEMGRMTFGSPGYTGTEKRTSVILSQSETASTSAPSGNLIFFNSNTGTMTERMRITSAGNVGIGTNIPDHTLQVVGTEILSTGPRSGFKFRDRTSGVATDNWVWYSTGNVARLHRQGGGDFMSVTANGNVGIGTAAPATALHVVGDVTVTGNISAKYQDVAEWVPSTQKLTAGTVVILDQQKSNQVLASVSAYDTTVAGVISEKPGIALGEAGEGKVLVATTGRVKVRVDATHAPIRVGDLLVTSATLGVAMRSQPLDLGGVPIHRPGTIIGKALEPLAGGTGEILVLLSLQ